MDSQAVEVLDSMEDVLRDVSHKIIPDELNSFIDLSKKLLNIIHLNIRGVRTNFDNLLVFLETYNLKYCDVIILSESHNITSTNCYNIPGYTCYYNEQQVFEG